MLAISTLDGITPVVGALVAIIAGARRAVAHTERVARIIRALAAIVAITRDETADTRTSRNAPADLHRCALGRTRAGQGRACAAFDFVAGVGSAEVVVSAILLEEGALAAQVARVVGTRIAVVAHLLGVGASTGLEVASVRGAGIVVVAHRYFERALPVDRGATVFCAQVAVVALLVDRRALARLRVARIVGALVTVVAGLRRVHALTVRATVCRAGVVIIAVHAARAADAGRCLHGFTHENQGGRRALARPRTRNRLECTAGRLVAGVVGAQVAVGASHRSHSTLARCRSACVVRALVAVVADLVRERALAGFRIAGICRALVAVVAGLCSIFALAAHAGVSRASTVVVAVDIEQAPGALAGQGRPR